VYGVANGWSKISKEMGNRTGKQCRERYFNHLKSDIKKGDWGEEEDSLILRLKVELDGAWCKIAKFLPGRTDNAIKNRWHRLNRSKISHYNETYISGSSDDSVKSDLTTNDAQLSEEETEKELLTLFGPPAHMPLLGHNSLKSDNIDMYNLQELIREAKDAFTLQSTLHIPKQQCPLASTLRVQNPGMMQLEEQVCASLDSLCILTDFGNPDAALVTTPSTLFSNLSSPGTPRSLPRSPRRLDSLSPRMKRQRVISYDRTQ
jgi:hypothetical protein